MLNGKTIVLGVSGGIAAFKAAALCSKLTQAGAEVRVIMTESAAKFVAPLTFQTLSRMPFTSILLMRKIRRSCPTLILPTGPIWSLSLQRQPM